MFDFFKKQLSFNLLIVNAIFIILLSVLLPVRFETNDDVIMLLMTSGKITGEFDAHLIHINYLYGLFLNFLYSLTDKIEWYTVSLLFLHLISLTIIVRFIIEKATRRWIIFILVLFFYILEVRLIVRIQFTTTAGFLTIASLLLLNNQFTYKKYIGFLLLSIASLLRYHAALIVIVVFLPVIFGDMFLSERIDIKKAIRYIVIFFSISVLHFGTNYIIKKDAKWNYFYNYSEVRYKITDNPNINAETINIKGKIARCDSKLFSDYFIDNSIFNLKTLQKINEIDSIVPLKYRLVNAYYSIIKYWQIFVIILLMFMFHVFYHRDKKTLIFQFLIFFLVFLYFSLTQEIKYRMVIIALLPIIVISVNSIYSKFFVQYIHLFLIGFIILYIAIDSINIYRLNNQHRKAFKEPSDLINKYNITNNSKIICYGTSFAIENIPPLNTSNFIKWDNVVFSGWLAGHPNNIKVFPSLLFFSHDNALFISKRDSFAISNIIESLKINYHKNMKAIKMFESNNYLIIKFKDICNN